MDSLTLAHNVRVDVIKMVHDGFAPHVGSALSIVDILAVLYSEVMHIDPKKPKDNNRDRFVLSKGHAGAAVYATLAECGFFDKEKLKTYYQNGSVFSGHVSHKGVPGIEASTGSLGHGFAMACGMAMALKLQEIDNKVYVIVGDGELDEGQCYETIINAPKYGLDNFTVIVDRNRLQAMGKCEDIVPSFDIENEFKSHGFTVITVDGHDHQALLDAFNADFEGRPKCIVANTIKGKGISFMEDNLLWHYKSPQGEMYDKALAELECISEASCSATVGCVDKKRFKGAIR